jgi:hypothetical protein
MRISRRWAGLSEAVKCLWREPNAAAGYTTAVSLHSHTSHSRESLDFIPRVMAKVAPLHAILCEIDRRKTSRGERPVVYDKAFWRPPLRAQTARDLEAGQIRTALGLEPIVSITDHDDIEACAELNALGDDAPYSSEWSAPYNGTMFHLGVHNMPAGQARELCSEMARYTAAEDPALLAQLLADLDAIPEVLIVLNHPLCNEERMGRAQHEAILREFLDRFGSYMHALELNGLQPAADNRDVVKMARDRGIPPISGGDRHCLEPNANLNLTHAKSLAEFIHEVRVDKVSDVLFMPQYREPILTRYAEFISQAVGTYKNAPGRERWVDRIFYESIDGETKCLNSQWPHGAPAPIECFVAAVRFLAAPHMRAPLRAAFGEQNPAEV